MNAIVPPLTTDDMLPDDRAVWRDSTLPPECPGTVLVTVEYFGGLKERTTAAGADWKLVMRWRFGWAPQAARPDPFEGLGLAAKE
jgi:hypothetical protein